MADFPPPSDPNRSADLRRRLLAGIPRAPITPPAIDHAAAFEDGPDATVQWSADDALRLEMERLQASLSANGPPAGYPDGPDYGGSGADALGYGDLPATHGMPRDVGRATSIPGGIPNFAGLPNPVNDAALDQLRSENAQLTRLLEEMRPILEEATKQESLHNAHVEDVKAREQDLLRQIEERDGQVQLLTEQIHELETHITEQAAKAKEFKPPPNEDELSRMADELEQEQAKILRERKELDQDRAQFREDEAEMMKQMREMECTMAKERADLARQRTELQRLHDEIQRELDSLQKADNNVTGRLAQFQRRYQEATGRGNGPPPETPSGAMPAPAPLRTSGMVRRLFGK
jgi:DNA repair exonuclease SbcCD ATPase subunit